MKTKLLFSWDITLLLVIASFIYVCFDKVIGLLALMAVSRDHPSMDMIPLLNNLTNLNGGYSEKLMGLVGTFFTIVLAGNLFKSQQQSPDSTIAPLTANAVIQDDRADKSVDSVAATPSSNQGEAASPLITKLPD
jgi:hypothetical protein